MRPTCCNHGCSKGVCCNTGKLSDPNPRYRPVCGHCQGANYGKHPYAVGVTPFVTGQCSNRMLIWALNVGLILARCQRTLRDAHT